MMRPIFAAAVLLTGCASAAVEPKAPVVPVAAAVAAAPLPSACADPTSKVCAPGADFAKRMCAGHYPDVVLSLFAKDTPWTRAYLTGNFESWNPSSRRSERARLVLDEEVLVMAVRDQHPGGIVVSGAGASYDVLRWDGACVSLDAQELTFARPTQAKRAAIPWRYLGDGTRKALLEVPKVASSEKTVSKECKDASAFASANAKRSGQCVRADAALNGAIVDYVSKGGKLPAPPHLP